METVSAFSNYDGGTIVFGIDDDGKIKGLADAKQSGVWILKIK
ncbi:MAG: ATP-binding protein [Blautia sp.]